MSRPSIRTRNYQRHSNRGRRPPSISQQRPESQHPTSIVYIYTHLTHAAFRGRTRFAGSVMPDVESIPASVEPGRS